MGKLKKRYVVPILLMAVSFAIFLLGLSVGLIYNPALGNILWLVAAVIGGVGFIRLVRVNSKQD